MSEKLTFFGTGPFLEESIEAIEQAYLLGDIKLVRGKLINDILKHPGPGMRKRTAGEIIRRFIPYGKNTGRVKLTPIIVFVASKFSKEAKIDILYYRFVQVHPIVKVTFDNLKTRFDKVEFKRGEVRNIVANLTGKPVGENSPNFKNILRCLRDFNLIIRVKSGVYLINEKKIAKCPFIFLLYHHFLSNGTVAPKTLEVRNFFNDFYNQSEEETTQMLLSYGDGFWVVERTAHLDQILLAYSNMDEFMKKFLQLHGGNS